MTTDGKEQTLVKPSSHYTLWCPFCDEWSTRDSMIGRKRLGMHITNKHSSEVRFKNGNVPPKLEEIS